MVDTPAEKLGKYTLEHRIAAGGMAEVFLAQDDAGRRCVIKRMLPNLLVDKQFAQMFLDEAKLVVQLNHPSIAQIYDFGQDRGVLYLAMEWVDGTNLRTIVKDFARRGEKIPVEFCARLVSQAALALGYAHRAAGLDGRPLKIIHRDVSPQNILLGNAGDVKLIDFGVAKATSASQQTAAGMIKGKFAYMSPEQLRGNPLDGRSDIFGLGLVLYELLASERAVPGSSEAEIAQNALVMKFPPIEQKRPDVPPQLKAIVARALAKDRDQRYDTAEDLAAELETFITPRRSKLTGADLAQLLPAGAVPDSSSHLNPIAYRAPVAAVSRGASTARLQGSPQRPAIDLSARETALEPSLPKATFWTPAKYELVAMTVINPPGLVPRAAALAQPPGEFSNLERTLPDDPIFLPRSRLRWFVAAVVLGFGAAAAGWWLLGTPADPVSASPTSP